VLANLMRLNTIVTISRNVNIKKKAAKNGSL